MKKVIRLTESELINLVKKLVNESKFENQGDIDAILDKINKYGIESLTWAEKELLNSPEDSEHNFEGSDDVHNIISKLSKSKLIDPDLVNVDEDGFELYSIPGKRFCYFDSYDFIRFNISSDDDGDIMVSIDTDDVFPNEDEDETECRFELYTYIVSTWGDHDIMVYCDDEDWEDSVEGI